MLYFLQKIHPLNRKVLRDFLLLTRVRYLPEHIFPLQQE